MESIDFRSRNRNDPEAIAGNHFGLGAPCPRAAGPLGRGRAGLEELAGFPPLSWYDALLELSRAPNGMLRPVELEKHMLLPQYSTSRLVDRLAEAGLAERKTCSD